MPAFKIDFLESPFCTRQVQANASAIANPVCRARTAMHNARIANRYATSESDRRARMDRTEATTANERNGTSFMNVFESDKKIGFSASNKVAIRQRPRGARLSLNRQYEAINPIKARTSVDNRSAVWEKPNGKQNNAPQKTCENKFVAVQSESTNTPLCNNFFTEYAYAQSSFSGKFPVGFMKSSTASQADASSSTLITSRLFQIVREPSKANASDWFEKAAGAESFMTPDFYLETAVRVNIANFKNTSKRLRLSNIRQATTKSAADDLWCS